MPGLLVFRSIGLGVVCSLFLAVTPSFGDEGDMPKGQGPCRSKVEELNATRKKIRECLQSWIQAAKTMGENPSDDCEDATSAFVDKAKEIKACRKEHQAAKAQGEAKPE